MRRSIASSIRAANDVVGGFAFPLEEQVGFADRVGFGVDLLAVEMRRDFLAVILRELLQGFFRDRQHSAGAERAVIKKISS